MSVSSTSTFELTRDQLIRRALQIAGLFHESQTTTGEGDVVTLASDILHMELLALQAEATPPTHIDSTTQALTSGEEEYSLDSDTLDVYVGPDNIAGTIVPSSGAESPVRCISGHDYQQIPTKDSSGIPTLVFIERKHTVKLFLWPVIDSSGYSFRYRKIHAARDASGSQTLDYSKRWQKAICYAVAHQLALAKQMGLDRVGYLERQAEKAKAHARASDVGQYNGQFYVMSR